MCGGHESGLEQIHFCGIWFLKMRSIEYKTASLTDVKKKNVELGLQNVERRIRIRVCLGTIILGFEKGQNAYSTN